jgi:hypothetical protein
VPDADDVCLLALALAVGTILVCVRCTAGYLL